MSPRMSPRVSPGVNLLVIAKEPVTGRVKTRLTPPYTPAEAAELAEAALIDTLRAVATTPAAGRVLALEGDPGPWLPPGIRVIPQRGDGLDDRIAAAFADVGGPAVLIGMDTPQITPGLLASAARALVTHDAVFGPATDGGFWLLGLRRPAPALVRGVPMSRPDTGAVQLRRLRDARLSVATLPALTDVDTVADVAHVAGLVPYGRFRRLGAASRGHAGKGHRGRTAGRGNGVRAGEDIRGRSGGHSRKRARDGGRAGKRPGRGGPAGERAWRRRRQGKRDQVIGELYEGALAGLGEVEIEHDDGHHTPLPVREWLEPRPGDESLLRRCSGPTLDVGSGPGRLTVALTERGLPALGIDITPYAVQLTRAAGGLALRRDVFGQVPGTGRWQTVLLADGNIGIGGDPAALLRRIVELLRPGGRALVEVESAATLSRTEWVRLRSTGRTSEWFRWARVSSSDIAAVSDMPVAEEWRSAGRWFVALSA